MTVPPPLLSLLVPSRRPDQLVGLIENLTAATRLPSSIELIVKIDDDVEDRFEEARAAAARAEFDVKFICTPRLGGIFTLWAAAQELFEQVHADAYFVMYSTDEIRFDTHHWDDRLKEYVGYYPDDLFRLKISHTRHRNYHNVFDCAIYPESFSIMTRRWLEVSEGPGDCWGTDAFHQAVSFHLGLGLRSYNSVWRQGALWRDVAIETLAFGGMDWGHDRPSAWNQAITARAIREWNRLTTYKVQLRFAYLSRRLHLYAWAMEQGIDQFRIERRSLDKTVAVVDEASGKVLRRLNYRPPRLPIYWSNLMRHVRLTKAVVKQRLYLVIASMSGDRAPKDQISAANADRRDRYVTLRRYARAVRARQIYRFGRRRVYPRVAGAIESGWRWVRSAFDSVFDALDSVLSPPVPGLERMNFAVPFGMRWIFKRTGYVVPDREEAKAALGRLRATEEQLAGMTFDRRSGYRHAGTVERVSQGPPMSHGTESGAGNKSASSVGSEPTGIPE